MTWTAVQPEPYQLEGAALAVSSKYCIIADDMGLGKTWQAIYAVTEIKKKTLVVVPASLSFNWKQEVKNLTDMRVYLFNKKSPEIPADAQVMIVPYSMLKYAESLFQWAEHVIADECQAWKGPNSLRTKLGYGLLKKYPPEYCTLLSGTPIKNRVQEFYVALRILALDPTNTKKITEKFPSYYTFCCHFSNVRERKVGYRTIVDFTGHKNVAELKTYLKGRYIRRMTGEVLSLPEEIFQTVAVEYKEDPKLREAWEEFGLNKNISRDISAKKNTAVAKASFTAEFAKTLKETIDTPILIVSDHREPVSIISLALSKYRVAMITGETPAAKRAEYVQQVQNNQLDFLVATIGSIEAGHTMTKSHHMILNDHSWVPASNAQVRKRIHRIGQKEKCIYISIVGGVMDAHIQRMLKSKEQTIKEVLSV